MLGLNNHQYGENIKNIPSDDSYPMISILFSKKDAMGVNALSLTVLDLINKSQIKCDIGLEGSYEVGKKLTPQDMEVMKKITLRIANKGELKTSETRAINLLKNMNKNKKFDLKSMAKQSNNSSIANKFEKDFNEYGGNCEAAKKIGLAIAERAKAKGISEVVFDRGGYEYHGRVKSLAEGAREGGLQF